MLVYRDDLKALLRHVLAYMRETEPHNQSARAKRVRDMRVEFAPLVRQLLADDHSILVELLREIETPIRTEKT